MIIEPVRTTAPRVGQLAAEQLNLALGRCDQAKQHADSRRLARPVGAEEAVDLPGGHL